MFFRAHGNIENKEPTGYGMAMLAPIGRNRIINGDFSVNQRGFTSTTTGGVFGHDRWILGLTGGTVTYSTQAPALGDPPESARAFARLVTSGQSAAGDYAQLVQRIESVRTLSGKTATVSFWAKAASGTPKVAAGLFQYFGTGGSPSSWVDTHVGQVTLSTTWARYSVTVAVPSIAGKTLGSDGNDGLWFQLWTSAGSSFNARTGNLGIQNITVDIWGVQVEEGPYATAFEQKSYADELRASQRYYHRLTGSLSGYAASTTLARFGVRLDPPLRAAATTPTLTTAGVVNHAGGNPAPSAVTLNGGYVDSAYLDLTVTGLTSGQGVTAYGFALDFTAEL